MEDEVRILREKYVEAMQTLQLIPNLRRFLKHNETCGLNESKGICTCGLSELLEKLDKQ